MNPVENSKDDIIKMIVFIKQKVSSMSLGERRDILRIIMKSGLEDHKIHSKGDGTQVKFKDLSFGTIVSINTYITQKINSKLSELQTLTEESITEST
jgi:hypothetical protein